MSKTIHEIDPAFKGRVKAQLQVCSVCDAQTLHTTPFLSHPFTCVANHGGSSLCCSCDTYTPQIGKVTVDNNGDFRLYCSLCCEPDSPEKQQRIEERRAKTAEEAKKPLNLSDPASFARLLGATSFSRRK